MKHACIIGVALRTLTLWKVMLALICTGFLPASTLQVIKILEPITEELNEARCLASPVDKFNPLSFPRIVWH